MIADKKSIEDQLSETIFQNNQTEQTLISAKQEN